MRQISILFSGGPDSTLAALYALERADRVHLLTFHHRLMSRVRNHRIVVEELRRRFGRERIVTYEEKIDALFNQCYFSGMQHEMARYRTFYVPWICGACKLAMHRRAIAYNRRRQILTVYDGANAESAPYFPAQTTEYIRVMREVYHSHGMEYECPVYDVVGTDKATEEFGMLSTRGTKGEHVYFSTQHSCHVGLLVHAHARLYYKPLRGRNRMKTLVGDFLGRMVDRSDYSDQRCGYEYTRAQHIR